MSIAAGGPGDQIIFRDSGLEDPGAIVVPAWFPYTPLTEWCKEGKGGVVDQSEVVPGSKVTGLLVW